jgi:Flp pilus assembly protein CpaB
LTATITATPTPTVTPIALGEIVVAVRPIPAGAAIPPEAVQRMPWPAESVPAQAVTTLDEAVNQVALVDFACYEPLLSEGVARREVGSGFEPLPNTCDALNGPPSMVLVDVVVAVQPLTAGTVIPPSAVALRPWPVGLVPPGALTSLADAVGQTVAIDLNREQPVLAGKLTPGS